MKEIFVLILGVILFSCSNLNSKTGTDATQSRPDVIENTNDMENAALLIPSWINEKTVIKMKNPSARTGEFASSTNGSAEFGYGFMEQIKNINTGFPKMVELKGWVYTTVSKPNLAIILDISENNIQYDWKAFPLTDSLTTTGKWVPFTASFYFEKPLNPEQVIKIFPWNQSRQSIYFDDFKISFQY